MLTERSSERVSLQIQNTLEAQELIKILLVGALIHCVQKKHPLTVSFISPWQICR